MQGKDKAGATDKPPPAGRLQAILDTILGNLQVVVSNVHIRYEVSSSAARASSQTLVTCC